MINYTIKFIVLQAIGGQNAVKVSLTLSLLVALVLGTDNHNFAVSFNYLAFVAHGLYGRSYFHDKSPNFS